MPSCPRLARNLLLLLCLALAPVLPVQAGQSSAALIERGRYLARAGDCVSCHTRPGGAPFAGGRALHTPFGTIYSANLTADRSTGIGRWSEPEFAHALREGVAPDGTQLYPAFPYTAYTLLSDEDVHALYAYLRTLAPVRYTPPPDALSFPFNLRPLIALWKLLYFRPARYVADPARSAEWNRGAYLTRGLGHCGACHTPHDRLGAERAGAFLSGNTYLDEIQDEVLEERITPMDEVVVRPWAAANLTPVRDGLLAWSEDEIAQYLLTGHNARAGAFGPMSEVIANGTRHLSAADAHAMAVYLKSIPPVSHAPPALPAAAVMKAGEIAYTTRCADCHLPSGLGVPPGGISPAAKTAPPLAGNAALQAADPATLINVVLYGAHEARVGEHSWPMMSGFELSVGLDDAQIAALCTYVRSSWGNHARACLESDVARAH